MSLPKPKAGRKARLMTKQKPYLTWEAFVQAKVDRTNDLLDQMDPKALRALIDDKKRLGPEHVA